MRERMPVTLAVLTWMELSYFLATPIHINRAGLRTQGALRLILYMLINAHLVWSSYFCFNELPHVPNDGRQVSTRILLKRGRVHFEGRGCCR